MAVAPIPDMPRPGDRAISSRFLEWIANAAQRILTLSTDAGGVVQGPNGTSIIMPSAADEPIWVQIEGDPVTDDPLSSISAVEILPKKGGDKEVKELGRKFGDDYPDRLFPAPGEEVPDTGKVVQAWPWLKRLEKSPDPPAPGDSTDPYKYIQEWVVMGTGESAEPCKDWKFYCRARRIKCMDDDPEGGDPDPDPDPACVPISDLKICFDDTIWLVGVRFWASYYGSGPVQYLWSFSGGGGRRGYITNAPNRSISLMKSRISPFR
ncbi:hypothetical protein KIH39_00080 [Telmatocola sphagniphila]|uniref:Uncharacterized protein n=1 Tax=Telmatocola sphagniphila TaxID=1123043 RepID=A0A8E6B5N1_9BACT|nr:hypothetical protein [Telmatocola sphagniphila]QVL32352.1 hypothetical protein KIH39_00080 [Telmatocola sphagniphila]